jgi:hypothetical protein
MEFIKGSPVKITHFHQNCELRNAQWDKVGAKRELLDRLNEWIEEENPNILSIQYESCYSGYVENGAWVHIDVLYQEQVEDRREMKPLFSKATNED